MPRSCSTRPASRSRRSSRSCSVLPPGDPPGRRCARVIVLGTPPAEAGRGGLAQRALEGFTRAVGKEMRPRRDRAARLRRAGRRAPDRRDAALSAVAALGVRVRAGRADRRGWRRLGRSTGSSRSRARSRSSRAPRGGSAPRSPRRSRAMAPRRRPRRAGAGGRAEAVADGIGGSALPATSPTPTRRPRSPRPSQRRGHRRPQRRHHPRPPLAQTPIAGRGDGVNLGARSGSPTRCSRRPSCCEERSHRLRLLHQRHRRQRGADELRDLEGGRDRHRPTRCAAGGRARRDDQRGRARFHRDADDGGGAAADPRGRPADSPPRRAGCR